MNPGDLNDPGAANWWALGGVFWTGAIRDHQARVRRHRHEVGLKLRNYALDDYFTVENAVGRNPDGSPVTPTVSARAKVDVDWTAVGDPLEIDQPETANSGAFAGRYRAADVRLRWGLRTADGYRVEVDSEDDSDVHITHSFVAAMKNGVFLS